ncbi:MAG: HEAT repeat domain-containing protein [Candidatus Electrothrix sp. MAN1_4]|nr:HEAT repeat domain-containing protein [Candidatus Electrothrix sp. MAN1_4]
MLDAFFRCKAEDRSSPGSLYSRVRAQQVPSEEAALFAWLAEQAALLLNFGEQEAAAVALIVMQLSYKEKNCQVPGMVEGLLRCLSGSPALSHAATWALGWMNDRHRGGDNQLNPQQLEQLLAVAAKPNYDSEALFWLSGIFEREKSLEAVDILLSHLPTSPTRTKQAIIEALGNIGDNRATDALITHLQDAEEEQEIRQEAAAALGKIGGKRATELLKLCLQDAEEEVRRTALRVLAYNCKDELDRDLLFPYVIGGKPGLDPQVPITVARINEAAEQLIQPAEEIARRYKELAERFGLTMEPEAAVMAGEK